MKNILQMIIIEKVANNFALNPKNWKNMINASRELEYALGDNNKKLNNETESIIVQRRATRASRI